MPSFHTNNIFPILDHVITVSVPLMIHYGGHNMNKFLLLTTHTPHNTESVEKLTYSHFLFLLLLLSEEQSVE